ncbi:hypothetical protein [Streptomyces sp. NPDC058145]|uniref:hypothetical protein n=1 Tax=Streptomyces sp. NPDC058145 TaxID=3346356 RepID=UPI0036EA8880
MADHFLEVTSVDEFIRLWESEDPAQFNRPAWAAMPLPVWWDRGPAPTWPTGLTVRSTSNAA